MNDDAVQMAVPIERRRPWHVLHPVGLWPMAMGYGLLLVGAVLIMANLRSLDRLGQEFTSLQAEVNDLTLREARLRGEMQARLDSLEKTLFGDVLAKLDKRPADSKPARIERWQLNRDRDLRDRLLRLEEWRFKVDR